MLKWTGYFVCCVLVLGCAYAITPVAVLFDFLIGIERRIAGVSAHRIKVEDLEMAYLRGGEGQPLVLLHGFGADKDNWNRIAPHLIRHFDVIAPDLPGFGDNSKDLKLDYDIMSQVARLNAFMARLGIDDFHLAGSSMGGNIAGNYAARHPQQVRSLWLLSPLGVQGAALSEMQSEIRGGAHPIVLPRSEQEFMQLFDYLFVEPPFVPQALLTYLGQRAVKTSQLSAKIYRQIHHMREGVLHPQAPLITALTQYQGPVLVSWGRQDRVLHPSGATVLAKITRHVTLDMQDNTGHLPMIERPGQSAEAFLAFVTPYTDTIRGR